MEMRSASADLQPLVSAASMFNRFEIKRELMDVDFGSVADWVSGLATAGALVFGFVGLQRERRKDRELSAKIAEEEHGRKKTETATQASKVSSWFDESSNTVRVRSASESVIYDVLVIVVNGRDRSDGARFFFIDEFPRMIRLIPPGETAEIRVPLPDRQYPHYVASSDLNFRDAQGITWFRNNWGELTQRDRDVFDHYGLEKPYDYVEPVRQSLMEATVPIRWKFVAWLGR
ncbi:hypothetical protein [Paenarthrobacter nitroguajacolicus]|uniref:hypothetical protein n=1 Tax=Paenarthrobacter nitroguajacolicus TaxID=211146 RepID=UPI003423B524